MQKMVLEILAMFVLGMNNGPCAGFPVYDYDLPSLRQALSASVADVNSRSLSPYLFRAFRSSVKRVNMLAENSLSMDIEFSIRETTCRRGSGEDPATCDFQRGYYVPAAACRSTVQMSAGQVQDVWVRCRWSSSSESDSSEELGFGFVLESSRWRSSDLFDLVPDRPTREQFFGRSLEAMRRVFPPGNRRSPGLWHRARVDTGFE
ncbi:secreted phosphoprotein 24 isoform X2 [Artibeus jamaicensis]|uniref:secreted phosphoprotein 24 isoform X2 n=1 Tax=Artibeus jamaicensis TaxID=9417 RepID=UPI00235A5312|nr:secreted phosphoprotein 24 isoform X2 [Artibeus jamaicensis]XP_037017331.2 secreted phosphoprotein 24 isoform X2 [Artibeus jamaicensis]XP_037017332.2 secreted phosphoprotein 24 isoform X2 [Artibeus jamaicensis]